MSGRQKASDESRKSIFYDLYQAGHVLIKIAVLVVLAAVLGVKIDDILVYRDPFLVSLIA